MSGLGLTPPIGKRPRRAVAIPAKNVRAIFVAEQQLGAETIFVNGKPLGATAPLSGEKLAEIVVEATKRVGGEVRFECADGSIFTVKCTEPGVVWLESSTELPS